MEKMLKNLAQNNRQAEKPKRHGGKSKNAPDFDARTLLLQMCGVDLTRIDGIDVSTAFKVHAEIGADLSRFKNAKNFASWLGLCPGTRITGSKFISAQNIPNKN